VKALAHETKGVTVLCPDRIPTANSKVSMLDCFALLNEPRRLWLDQDSLKQKFLALSADVHPDRVHQADDAKKRAAQQRYAELNSAYNRLRDTKERLLHLLELELGSKPEQVQSVPPVLMKLFMEVSQIYREIDSFLAEKAKTTSPVLLVRLFERGQEWTNKLTGLQQRLNAFREQLTEQLKAIDAKWEPDAEPDSMEHREVLQQVEELYRLFSYTARWTAQVQERIVQLSF
jgi:DnaJ-domain-containing protein 1